MGSSCDSECKEHPFFSVLKDMGVDPEAQLNEQELSVLVAKLAEQIGETLPPQEVSTRDSLTEELPEQLTGDSLMAYLMANAGKNDLPTDLTGGNETLPVMDSLDSFHVKGFDVDSDVLDPEVLVDESVLNADIESDSDGFEESPLTVVPASVGGTSVDVEQEPVALNSELEPSNSETGDAELTASIEQALSSSVSTESIAETSLNVEEVPSTSATTIDSTVSDATQIDPVAAESNLSVSNQVTDDALTVNNAVLDEVDPAQVTVAAELGTKSKELGLDTQGDKALTGAKPVDLKDLPKLNPQLQSNSVSAEDAGDATDLKASTITPGTPQTQGVTVTSMPGEQVAKVSQSQITASAEADMSSDLEKPALSLNDLNLVTQKAPTKLTQEQATLLQMDQQSRPMKLSEAGQALVDKIQTMISGEFKHALIRLDPPELGLLEIKIQVHQEQTQVQIVTQSTQVRDALEQQSARLRESLSEQGLSLSDLDVSDQQSQQEERDGSGLGQQGEEADDIDSSDSQLASGYQNNGLVDQYV
jgi:flagellar hook-length control protein FliK